VQGFIFTRFSLATDSESAQRASRSEQSKTVEIEKSVMQNSNYIWDAFNQWATRPADERFESLGALQQSVNSRRMRSRATDVDTSRLTVEAAGSKGSAIKINSVINECAPTHWAFGQLASNLGAPSGYLRTLPADKVVGLLNHHLSEGKREAVKFMTVEGDGDNTPNILQAVTSTTYGRIWDAEVVEAVQRVNERTGGRFHNPLAWAPGHFGDKSLAKPSGLYASDHDCFMFLIDGGSELEVGPRATLNRGFIAWNSETAARSFGLMTFLFNKCCGNHIIYGAENVNQLIIRHTSGGPSRFDREAAPQLKAYVEASAQPLVDAVRKAQDYLLPVKPTDTSADKLESLLDFCGRQGKFTRNEVKSARDFANSEEGECRTLWQLIQGFTAYSRGFEFIDARLDLEKRAGKLMGLVS
jgi:hypothetical protein